MDEPNESIWFDPVGWTSRDYLNMPQPIPSGYGEIDRHLCGGFRPGVYTILGRPGEGKSALAIAMMERIASRGEPAAIVSLEMPAADAWLRCASAHSVQNKEVPQFAWSAAGSHSDASVRFGGKHLSTGEDPIITAGRVMSRMPLFITAPEEPNIDVVLDRLVRANDKGARIAVLDYLQLIDVPGIDREYERVSAATRAVVNLAKSLKMAIIVIAAMNREGLTGSASMHSAAGSSLIEYASTCVMTYVRDKDAQGDEGTRTMNLNIEKNRSGMVTLEPIRMTYWPAFNCVIEEKTWLGIKAKKSAASAAAK